LQPQAIRYHELVVPGVNLEEVLRIVAERVGNHNLHRHQVVIQIAEPELDLSVVDPG
jgi:hypothetical protein